MNIRRDLYVLPDGHLWLVHSYKDTSLTQDEEDLIMTTNIVSHYTDEELRLLQLYQLEEALKDRVN